MSSGLGPGSGSLLEVLTPKVSLYKFNLQGTRFYLFCGTLYQMIVLALIVPESLLFHYEKPEQIQMRTVIPHQGLLKVAASGY